MTLKEIVDECLAGKERMHRVKTKCGDICNPPTIIKSLPCLYQGELIQIDVQQEIRPNVTITKHESRHVCEYANYLGVNYDGEDRSEGIAGSPEDAA